MRIFNTTLSLTHLRCNHKPDGWSIAEPYMWNIFFKIDGSTIKVTDQFRLEGKPVYKFSEGSQGNLNARNIGSGDIVSVPKEVGEWRTTLVPLRIPYFEAPISGVIGLVSVLMEQNYVSSVGAEAGHQALNRYVEEAIDSCINEFEPKKVDIGDIDRSVKKFFDSQVAKFTENIGKQVEAAVSGAQNVVQNLVSLVKKDVVIGYNIWDFGTAGIEKSGGEMRFSQHYETKKYGEWEVKGVLTAVHDEQKTNALRRKKAKGEEE